MSDTAQTGSCGSRTLRVLDLIKKRPMKTGTPLQQDVIAQPMVYDVAEEQRARGLTGATDIRGTDLSCLDA